MSKPAPACPYCGERQSVDDTIPGKPKVSSHYGAWVRGKWRDDVKETYYDDFCRKCGKQISYGFRYGNGTLGDMGKPAVFHWSKVYG